MAERHPIDPTLVPVYLTLTDWTIVIEALQHYAIEEDNGRTTVLHDGRGRREGAERVLNVDQLIREQVDGPGVLDTRIDLDLYRDRQGSGQ